MGAEGERRDHATPVRQALRALRILPVQEEERPARRVHALVGVGAEVVALGLEEVGEEPRRPNVSMTMVVWL
jgi:hypothetical protein